jgi:alpha-1,2-mannosyltransferase
VRLVRIRPFAGWLALAGSVTGYVLLSALVYHQPFHAGLRELRFFDLRVYRGAARRIIERAALYRRPIIHRLGFTYPPAAALLLAPLALAPLAVDKVIVTGLSLGALVWLLYCTLRLGGVRDRRSLVWSGAALIAAAALWLEPVTTTLGYGQIDLVIVALVMFDLARSDDGASTGVAIGIAAGIKLTPLMFIAYLMLCGRCRVAAVATGSFVATILVSFAVAGQDAGRYWGGLILDSSRVGGAGDAANQSLRGALSRLTDTPHPGAGTELLIIVVAGIGLALAVLAARRGQTGLGFGLCAVTTLLASPVSWTHHWTLTIPALVLLGLVAHRDRSLPLAVAAIVAAAVGYAYLPEHFMGRGQLVTGWGSLAADAYVLCGVAALMAATVYQLRVMRQPDRKPPAHPVPA